MTRWAKVPGIGKGKKTIIVGFADGCNGYRALDPETRRYSTVDNVYFYVSFKHRIDALRHHDQRRALIRSGKPQPVQVDDWEDSNAEGVRNLFTSPDGAQRKEESPEEAESGSEESHIVRPLDEDWPWRYFAQLKCCVPFGFFQLGRRPGGRSKMLTSLLTLVNAIYQSVMSRILSQRVLRLG